MEPIYPGYEEEMDEYGDLRATCVQAATRLTCTAIQSQLVRAGATAGGSADEVLSFFEAAYRRIRELVIEEEEEYLVDLEENGDDRPS